MTTAILHPEGLSDINLIAAGDPTTEDYVIQLGTLDLHESERLEIAYSEGASIDGGEAISSHGPLVPITFDVIVHGSGVSEDAARQQLIQYVQALGEAICNPQGGTFEHKPDDLGGGVRSTFYHYVQSRPPKLRAGVGNNWDAAPVVTDPSNYVFALELEIELQTQPYATSDPDSPATVKTATTVYNQNDGVVGYATIPAASIIGTEPALTQLRIRNLVSGTWAAIGKLLYARRADPGDNFNPILEGGTPDTTSSIWWSTESDTTRRSDNFQRYSPPESANDLWASLSYTLSNPTDHEGRVAVAVVCRSWAEGEAWDIKAAIEVAGTEMETGIANLPDVGTWVVGIVGELDIPPTPISADESYSPILKLYLRRTSGDEANALDIDFVMLLFVDEYPQQVNVPGGYTDAYKLLLENLDRDLCHVVDQSTLAFEKTAEPLCPLLQLEPGVDNRLDFIWERLLEAILEDDFEGYEAWGWFKVGSCESVETWAMSSGSGYDTTLYVEGEQGLETFASFGVGYAVRVVSVDLTADERFTDDDFVYIAVYRNDTKSSAPPLPTVVSLRFRTTPSDWFEKDITADLVGDQWVFLKYKKSDFAVVGSPSWANIQDYYFYQICTNSNFYITFDDWRIVKADPDDATKGNDTGPAWDFMRDVWHVCEMDDADKSIGCLDITAALEQVALIDEDPPANIKYLAKVRAKRDDGEVGLVFRCADGTSGSEDMAAFFIDTANDQLELRKWAAGSASDIASAVSQTTAPDTDYWLGVWIINQSTVSCYFGTSLSDIWDEETESFHASARKFNETDSVFATGGALESGQCGLLSIGTLGRFDDVELYAVGEGHVPGDTISVEAKAIYRTIYPFRE